VGELDLFDGTRGLSLDLGREALVEPEALAKRLERGADSAVDLTEPPAHWSFSIGTGATSGRETGGLEKLIGASRSARAPQAAVSLVGSRSSLELLDRSNLDEEAFAAGVIKLHFGDLLGADTGDGGDAAVTEVVVADAVADTEGEVAVVAHGCGYAVRPLGLGLVGGLRGGAGA